MSNCTATAPQLDRILTPPQPPALLAPLRSAAMLVHRQTVLLACGCAGCDCRAFGRVAPEDLAHAFLARTPGEMG